MALKKLEFPTEARGVPEEAPSGQLLSQLSELITQYNGAIDTANAAADNTKARSEAIDSALDSLVQIERLRSRIITETDADEYAGVINALSGAFEKEVAGETKKLQGELKKLQDEIGAASAGEGNTPPEQPASAANQPQTPAEQQQQTAPQTPGAPTPEPPQAPPPPTPEPVQEVASGERDWSLGGVVSNFFGALRGGQKKIAPAIDGGVNKIKETGSGFGKGFSSAIDNAVSFVGKNFLGWIKPLVDGTINRFTGKK